MPRISVPTTKGFTLIELMVVLAIVAAVVVTVLPQIGNRDVQVKGFLREFTVLSRELHTRARLNGTTYRLVINLGDDDPNSDKQVQQTYWVERTSSKTVIRHDEEATALERSKEKDDDGKPLADPDGFQPDGQIMKKPKALPSGLTIDRIELTRLNDPISHGKVFIHYLPQGLVDEAAIHLKSDKGQSWTISINPLTGRGEVFSKSLTLKEIKAQ